MRKLLTITQLAEELGMGVETIRTLSRAKKIPSIRPGYRTVFYDADAVRRALERFTVQAIGS